MFPSPLDAALTVRAVRPKRPTLLRLSATSPDLDLVWPPRTMIAAKLANPPREGDGHKSNAPIWAGRFAWRDHRAKRHRNDALERCVFADLTARSRASILSWMWFGSQ